MWPEGDEALPLDAQDLITRLLRQSPMDRLGTGKSVGQLYSRPNLPGCVEEGAGSWGFEGSVGVNMH
jgi:hypothetical protein